MLKVRTRQDVHRSGFAFALFVFISIIRTISKLVGLTRLVSFS